MFAKIILSIIIISATATMGYLISYGYVQRLSQLRYLHLSFQLLETEIIYASNPLPIAMKKVGEKSNKTISKIFIDTYNYLHSKMGYSIEQVWNMALNNYFKQTFLNKEDKEILMDFGKNLGFTDKENQIKNFRLIYLQLEKQQKIAEQLRTKNEKMCKSLGLLVGIGIVVVFI